MHPVGARVGLAEGESLGDIDGDAEGLLLGDGVGDDDGDAVGDAVGDEDGNFVGLMLGDVVGAMLGDSLGTNVGALDVGVGLDGACVAPGSKHIVAPDDDSTDQGFGQDVHSSIPCSSANHACGHDTQDTALGLD